MTTDLDTEPRSNALEPWTPPVPPSATGSAFHRIALALRPAIAPVLVGAVSWVASVHGAAHSVGDTITLVIIAGVGAVIGTAQTVAAARKTSRPTAPGESEPRTGLLAVRAGLAAWAVAGLSALAAADMYTTNTALRVLYTVIAAAAPVAYRRLVTEHRDELHLALAQKLALEQAVAKASITVEQMRQDGATTRTVTEQEHETIRTRLTQDAKTRRAQIEQETRTVEAVLGAYTRLNSGAAAPIPAPGTRGKADPGHGLPESLRTLLEISPTAAGALGADTLALLARRHPAGRHEPEGNYL